MYICIRIYIIYYTYDNGIYFGDDGWPDRRYIREGPVCQLAFRLHQLEYTSYNHITYIIGFGRDGREGLRRDTWIYINIVRYEPF